MTKRLAVLVHHQSSLGLSLFLPAIFELANREVGALEYLVELVDGKGSRLLRRNGAEVRLSTTGGQYDVVFIPPIDQFLGQFESEPAESRFLCDQVAGGAVVAASCLGSLVVAAAGLLDGQVAFVHPYWLDFCCKMFPSVLWSVKNEICESGSVITSGGLVSQIDVAFYLISKLTGPSVSENVTRCFGPRKTQDEQASNLPKILRRLESWVEVHLAEDLKLPDLANFLGVGIRQLNRLTRDSWGMSPGKWLASKRIHQAKVLLSESKWSLTQVREMVGIEDPSRFRILFKAATGQTPAFWRKSNLIKSSPARTKEPK